VDKEREILWLSLHPLLDAFAKQVTASDPDVYYSVERFSNDAYFLSGYISLFKDAAAGDALAISVDAFWADDGMVALSSDACMDDETGEILAEGPAVCVQLSEISLPHEGTVTQWLSELKDFLSSIEALVKNRIATL
jgi:hypothetical protein